MSEASLMERIGAEPGQSATLDAIANVLAMRGLLLHELCAISARMRSIAVKNVLSKYDLDMRDWLVLAALCELGPASQREIVWSTQLDKVAVNRAAARLKDRKLITSCPNERDGRSHILELSETGAEAVTFCATSLVEMERQILSGLSDNDNSGIRRLLRELGKSIDCLETSLDQGSSRHIPPPLACAAE